MTPLLYASAAMIIVAIELHLQGNTWLRGIFLLSVAINFFAKAFIM